LDKQKAAKVLDKELKKPRRKSRALADLVSSWRSILLAPRRLIFPVRELDRLEYAEESDLQEVRELTDGKAKRS